MALPSDAQLLRDYAEKGAEAAFREIVDRHAGLVYASALRQVACPEVARDVAQTVFLDLARKAQPIAATLDENASLVGWLYRGTRFAALTVRRDQQRRQTRERQVMDQPDSTPEPVPDWDQVRPLLDEAMADLNETDREALLLRYFKDQDFRAVGAALGISDDAAQKRVSRAVDRLRLLLTRRGITTSAAALGTVLSAQAVPPAPAGLAAALSAAALSGAALHTTSALAATKTIAMTTLQKTALTLTLAVAIGTGVYQGRQAAQWRNEVRALNRGQDALTSQFRQLKDEADRAHARLAALQEENQQLRQATEELPRLRGELARLLNGARPAGLSGGPDNPAETAARSWLDRVSLLKQRLEQTPEARIPELQLATEQDWLNAAKGELRTEQDYRRALSALRSACENKFVSQLQPALAKYLEAHEKKFPSEMSELQPYFDSPVDEAILQRYQIVPAGDLPNLHMGDKYIITQRSTVDEEYDARWGVGPNGYGTSGPFKPSPLDVLTAAVKSFAAANNGLEPTDPAQLQPYVSTPAQKAALQKVTDQFNAISADDKNRLEKAIRALLAGSSRPAN